MIGLSDKYPKVDIFHCRIGNIDVDGNLISYGDCHKEFELCLDFLYYRGCLRYNQTAPEFMFRISALRSIGGFISFPVGFFSDDATWFSLSKNNGIVYSNNLLFKMRLSGINISTRKDIYYPKALASFKYIKWIHNFILELQVDDNQKIFYQYVAKHCDFVAVNFMYKMIDNMSWNEWRRSFTKLPFETKAQRNVVIKNRIKKIINIIINKISFGKL